MADYYSQIAFEFGPLSDEQLKVCQKWLNDYAFKQVSGETYGELNSKIEGDNIYIYAEENFDSDGVIDFFTTFYKSFPDYPIFTTSYALTCSKPRVDAYAGGVFAADCNGTSFIRTDEIEDILKGEYAEELTNVINKHRE